MSTTPSCLARPLFTLGWTASLLLCVAVCVLWVRSIYWPTTTPVLLGTSLAVYSADGHFALYRSPWQPPLLVGRYATLLTLMLVVPVAAIAQWLFVWYQPRSPSGDGLCPACGYDLRASPERCPECGAGATWAELG